MKERDEIGREVAAGRASTVNDGGGEFSAFDAGRFVEVGDHLQAIGHIFQLLEL